MTNRALMVVLMLASVLPAMGQKKENERIGDAATVMKEILGMPDSIPKDLLDRAECVVIYPSVKKAAFVVGGSYGRGLITCRKGEDFSGPWSAPAMFALEGGSFGFQIGAQATDFVLLVMNEKGANSVMTSKVKLGADASAAAGPVGRAASAETDIVMNAEILSYSRSKGCRPCPTPPPHQPGATAMTTPLGTFAVADRAKSGASAVARRTRETDITVTLDLDGTGRADVATGVGFYDHLLTSLAHHGLFDLDVRATGDLEVDEHHTVEDVALVLGRRDRRGARRPCRDRPLRRRRRCRWTRPLATARRRRRRPARMPSSTCRSAASASGALSTQLVEHALESFARTAGVTLHLRGTRPQRPPPCRGGVQGAGAGAARGRRAGSAPARRVASTKGSARVTRIARRVDYGAGNLVQHRAGARGGRAPRSSWPRGAATFDGADAARRARASVRRRRRWTACAGAASWRRSVAWIAAGSPVPGHLPRAPAPVRGQRRGRRRDAGRAARPDRPPRRRAAPAAHRLEPGGAAARAPARSTGSPTDADFYFVHSYAAAPAAGRRRAWSSPRRTTAAASSGRRARAASLGVQFHPERSGRDGLRLLANFVALVATRGASPRERRRARPAAVTLMLPRRVIPCLDVADGRVVKGTRFVDLVDEGDPPELAERYAAEGADEIVFLDIDAAPEGRGDAARRRGAHGASRVRAADRGGRRAQRRPRCATCCAPAPTRSRSTRPPSRDPDLVRRCARRFGSQAVVVAIDARRRARPRRCGRAAGRSSSRAAARRPASTRSPGPSGPSRRRRRAARDVDRPRRHPGRLRHRAAAGGRRPGPRPGDRLGRRRRPGRLRRGRPRRRRLGGARGLHLPPAPVLDRATSRRPWPRPGVPVRSRRRRPRERPRGPPPPPGRSPTPPRVRWGPTGWSRSSSRTPPTAAS